jgi:hypothetical protein
MQHTATTIRAMGPAGGRRLHSFPAFLAQNMRPGATTGARVSDTAAETKNLEVTDLPWALSTHASAPI